MSSTLSSPRSRFSAGATKPSLDASLVSAGQKDVWLSIKEVLLDRRILLAIALLSPFCIGGAAALGWQFSRQVAPIPQTRPAPVALSSTLEQQFEAMSSGLAAVQQSLGELAAGLGQMRRDIADLQTSEQALFDKISELPARLAATGTTKPVPRPSQVPPVR
jgi:septal ring factor EnvC (AmiA/AmiB activator)